MSTRDLGSIRADIDAYRAVDAQIKALQDTKAQLRTTIEQALGDSEIGTLDGENTVTWKFSKRRSLDQAALKKEHPELVARYVTTTEVRTLKVL